MSRSMLRMALLLHPTRMASILETLKCSVGPGGMEQLQQLKIANCTRSRRTSWKMCWQIFQRSRRSSSPKQSKTTSFWHRSGWRCSRRILFMELRTNRRKHCSMSNRFPIKLNKRRMRCYLKLRMATKRRRKMEKRPQRSLLVMPRIMSP